MMRTIFPLTSACLFLLLTGAARADHPTVSYIFPAGGQRGKTVKVHVGGHYLHGEAPFRLTGPGVRASDNVREVATKWFEGPVIPQPASQKTEDYPKDHEGEVKIAADAPLGVRYWRVWTSQGVTPAMKFVVGDLPEITEEEIDGRPIPVDVQLPVTINGRIFPREDVDVWSFQAKRGQTVWCEVNAARIGSPLDARLEIRDPSGRRIAENTDFFGADSFVRFTAPASGAYQVHIHDINYGGLQHYVYRLTVSAGPHVLAVYPAGGRRGSKTRFRLIGTNVADEEVDLELPNDAGTSSSIARRVKVKGGWTNRFLLELSDVAESLEHEPNDSPEQALRLAAPSIANGRIDRPGDVDWWSFVAKKDETVQLDLKASRLGSPLDSVLTVLDGKGAGEMRKVLASSDDLASGQTDSRLTFRAPADGTYLIRIEERFARRGGPRFIYRLELNGISPEPDFQLTLASDAATVLREGKATVKLNVQRSAGFKGAIKLKLIGLSKGAGLPKGVTFAPTEITAKQSSVQLTFNADKSAKIGVSEFSLIGTAQIGDSKRKLKRVASVATARGSAALDKLFLAVALPTPFKVTAEYRSSYAGQGTTHRKRFTIERNGYDGPLRVMLADRQVRHLQGVTGPKITVPAGETEFEYALQLPPWLAVGRTSRTILMAIGEVVDADGSRHRVSYSSQAQNDQLIVLADPCPLNLSLRRASMTARSGETLEVQVRIERSQKVKLPLTLELVLPAHVKGITAKPVSVPADQSTATLRIRFAKKCGPFNMPLILRGTARRGEDRFVAETNLEIVPEANGAGR